MKLFRQVAHLCLLALILTGVSPVALGFNDVRLGVTPYSQAIESLQKRGIVEGYSDGTFKPTARMNRAEFLKIILESRGTEIAGNECFPDVNNEWFAEYVCTAKNEGIIDGYPDGSFKPEQPINFAEASKILARAYGQEIDEYSPDWYEPFVRALETSKAIPLSVENLEQQVNRGEMAEMMWRLTEEKIDQPSKGYLNVKYPNVMINMASDVPQRASSCSDIKAFTEEANRGGYYGGGVMMRDGMMTEEMAMPTLGIAKTQQANLPSFSDTNVQVSGVDEADIVKTDGTYVYVIFDGKIRILRAFPANEMELISTTDLQSESFNPTEMYVDEDRLILLGNSWIDQRVFSQKNIGMPYYGGSQSEVRIYSIADRTAPSLVRTVSFDGSTISTRMIGSKLYMILNETFRWYRPEPILEPQEIDLLPKLRDTASSSVEQPVSRCSDVIILPHIPQPQYLIAAVIPTDDTSKEVQREMVIGNAENIYSSLQNLYVAATQWQYHWRGPVGDSEERTSIYRFAYTDSGIELKAHSSVPGRILNQFSMDEHEGHFRIATTEQQDWRTGEPSKNNVYVLNLNLESVGGIEDIAPGETIYSARFMGDRAYMVTFKKIDPFFALDLSDPANPKILGKLKIPGYSDYLHPYDENHIIGFGKEAVESKDGDFTWYQGMKMAIFDVTDPENPKQLHRFGIGDRGTESPLLHNHKALLFDKERNLLAFPITVHKLTDEQKQEPEGMAWGQPVFQGAYVFNLDLDTGFTLRGTISHYNQQDYLKAGSYFYGKNIERIIRIENDLITLSPYGIQSHSEDNVNLQKELPFDEPIPSGGCLDDDTEGVSYVSKDPQTCTVIDYACEKGRAFSNACGCGCIED